MSLNCNHIVNDLLKLSVFVNQQAYYGNCSQFFSVVNGTDTEVLVYCTWSPYNHMLPGIHRAFKSFGVQLFDNIQLVPIVSIIYFVTRAADPNRPPSTLLYAGTVPHAYTSVYWQALRPFFADLKYLIIYGRTMRWVAALRRVSIDFRRG